MTTSHIPDSIDQPTAARAHAPAKKPLPLGGIIGIAAGVAICSGIAGFAIGAQYQKMTADARTGNSQATGFSGQQGFGPRGGDMMRNGTFGEVTAISDTSITVATRQRFNQNSGSNTSTSKTYTINNSTTITVNGQTAKASDIKTGDEVMIVASSSDSAVAASIRVGMGAPTSQQSSDPGDTDPSTRTN